MEELKFLKEITDLPGGSGNEDLVRGYLKDKISSFTTAKVDNFGNVYGEVGKGPKVLAVGHMDEVGFIVRSITKDGYIKLGMVGFVFPYGIISQVYNVVTNKGLVSGVIGMNPCQSKGQLKNEYPALDSLYLDVGAHSKQGVEELGIEVGNAVIAKSQFTILKNKEILAKAWDNRIGCAISLRVMEELSSKDIDITFIGGGTVQEEVGCRGAKALVLNTCPDIAFSLDTAPAESEDGAIPGKGPQLIVMDTDTIAHKKLLNFVKEVAKDNDIPYQLYVLRRGGSDTSEFQNVTGGVPCVPISIPVKYIHTPTSVISYYDYENAIKLMVKVCEALNEEKIKEIKSY